MKTLFKILMILAVFTGCKNAKVNSSKNIDEAKHWDIIEKSWEDSSELNQLRIKTLKSNNSKDLSELSGSLGNDIIKNYSKRLHELSKEELTDYIRWFEKKLYDIDRLEIHRYTDGGDDGFLYARIFIVGMGKKYYDMIDSNPSKATYDLGTEVFGFTMYMVYREKFGESFERGKYHDIESGSNPKGRRGWY